MNNLTTAHWLLLGKYFIKCSNCRYELFNSNRIATPRNCPHCNSLMREQHGPLYNFLERNEKV